MKYLFFLFSFFVYSYTEAQINTEQTPKINTVGVGKISVFPNAAELTITIENIKPALRDALNGTQQTTDKVLSIIKKYTTDSTLVKTSLITTDKSTEWNNRLKKEVFLGYQSSQKIIFTLKDLNRMQDFTEELLKTNFRRIENVSYFHTLASEYIKQAQELAVQDAIETTKRIAKSSGVKVGKILSISTDESPNQGRSIDYDVQPTFESFSKSMGGRGVKSTGDIINYIVSISLSTAIEP